MTESPSLEPTPDEAALEERLRALSPPPVPPGLAADLRGAFCTGFRAADGDPGSRAPSHLRSSDQVTSNEQIERALRSAFATPQARPAYRRDLRAHFVTGGLAAGERAVARERPLAAVRLLPQRPALRLLLGGLAAAALIFLVAQLAPRPDRWRAVEVQGQRITLDGKAVRMADLAELGPEIMAADVVETGEETSVLLVLADRFRLDVRPGTRFRPHALAELVPGTTSGIDLEQGEIFVDKNPEGEDAPLTVVTADVEVAVTGTVVGIQCFQGGTCVCVIHGDARVSCCEVAVSPGHSHVTRPGRPCEEHAFPPGTSACPADGPNHTHACRLVHFDEAAE